jgi:hypothetical protein
MKTNILNQNNFKIHMGTVVFLTSIWPATILLILIMQAWESYRRHQAEKIFSIVRERGYRSLYEAIPHLSIKELKLLYSANKTGAIALEPKNLQLVQQYMIDKCFEKTILGDLDGKK